MQAFKARRIAQGLSQAAMAEKLGMSLKQVGMTESGVREPRIHALVRLYRGVGLNLYLDFEEIEDE